VVKKYFNVIHLHLIIYAQIENHHFSIILVYWYIAYLALKIGLRKMLLTALVLSLIGFFTNRQKYFFLSVFLFATAIFEYFII